MRFKNSLTLFLILIFLVATISTLCLFFDHIAVYAISKIHNLDISYGTLKNVPFKELIFTNLTVMDEKRGIGLFSRYTRIKPKWDRRSPRDIALDFDMKDVRFIRKEKGRAETYDTISGLVYVPFTSRWTYSEVSGKINTFKKGVHIKDLLAMSDDIKLSLTGDMYHNNELKSDVAIYFSKRIADKIPEVLSKVILQDEKGGWKSLSVGLRGNYKSPAIHISSKLFKLNIGAVSKPSDK